MNQHTPTELWAVILAGGDGCRLREYTSSRFGESLPKQFCTFQAGESLLQRTARRVARLVPSEHTVVTVPAVHAALAARQLSERPVHLAIQPQNKDTSPALFLSLMYVRRQSPDALAIIVPSDHHITPTSAFVRAVLRAVDVVSTNRNQIVLLGVKPSHYDTDQGLIVPHPPEKQLFQGDSLSVASFMENPSRIEFDRVVLRQAHWNTFIMVGAVSTFWRLGWQTVPAVVHALEKPVSLVNTRRESVAVARAFRRLPSSNFSRDVLSHSPHSLRLVPMHPLVWLDLGRPERAERVFGATRQGSLLDMTRFSADNGTRRSAAGRG